MSALFLEGAPELLVLTDTEPYYRKEDSVQDGKLYRGRV
jgi:hypothetical protein